MLGCLLTPLFVVCGVLWAVFPRWAMYLFLGVELLVFCWPLTALRTARTVVESLRERHELELTDAEWAYLRKHALVFVYPANTRSLSGLASTVMFLTIGIGIVLLFRQEWIGAGVCAVNYFVLAPYTKYLCPFIFVADGYAKDPIFWGPEKRRMDACIAFVESVLEAKYEDAAAEQTEDAE